MFDKEAFKIRLDLFIRQWLDISHTLNFSNMAVAERAGLIGIIFTRTVTLMFELRAVDVAQVGTHDPITEFARVLEIGLNQLKDKLWHEQQKGLPATLRILHINILIKECVNDLADDIEELLKIPVTV